MIQQYTLKIFRGTPGHQYWEEFVLNFVEGANVISSLMDIRKNPVNKEGKRVQPVVWEDGCLEEVCGSCSMLVMGKPRQACTALIKNLVSEYGPVITLAPFTKFPLVRDLMVDRSQMFDNLKKVRGWIDNDSIFEKGSGPKISPQKQEIMYVLSTCMTCGCCSEGCPQVNPHSDFIGPAAISQVRLFNAHPTGKMMESERLRTLMKPGGVSDCGNAQNCSKVCPKNIPLTDSIAAMSRDVTIQAVRDFFSFPDRGI